MEQEHKYFEKKTRLAAVCIFLAVISWIFLLTQGLPIGDHDDWDHVLAAQDLPWKDLAVNVTTPWSTSSAWVGQSNRLNEVLHRRVFLTFMLKSVHALVGFHPLAYYLVTKGVFFAGTVTLIFLMLYFLTRSWLYSLAGIAFFVLIPAHYPHLLWLTDPITMVHFFMVVGLSIFLILISNLENRQSFRHFFLFLIFLLIIGWLAMKTKEPALTLPVSTGLFLLCHGWRWRGQGGKLFFLTLVLGFLVFLIVPLGGSSEPGILERLYNPKTIFRMLFQNFECGYQDEKMPALLSWEYVWPVSIARTYGFFLLWSLFLVFAVYLVQRTKAGRPPQMKTDTRTYLIRILLFWTVYEVSMMGFFQPDPRYFSGLMIPITLLTVTGIHRSFSIFSKNLKRVLAIIVLFSLACNFAYNLRSIVWLRLQVGMRTHRFYHIAEQIYKDQFPQMKFGTADVGYYYCVECILLPESQPRMIDVTFFVGMGYEGWNKSEPGRRGFETFAEFARKGAIYYATSEEVPFSHRPEIVKIATISGVNENSFFEQMIYKIKGKLPEPFVVYKWIG